MLSILVLLFFIYQLIWWGSYLLDRAAQLCRRGETLVESEYFEYGASAKAMAVEHRLRAARTRRGAIV